MKKYWILLSLAFVFGCQPHKELKIDGFDNKLFRSDRAGCNGIREKQIEVLKSKKSEFLAVSENEIFETFGRYDYQILDKKNEKAFVYFLEKGPQCQAVQNPSAAKIMLVKFNAISRSKEILFINANEIE